MTDNVFLSSRRINHGQSEIWLSDGSTELTKRRTIASNEARNVVKRLCPNEFQKFYDELYARLDVIATLNCPNLDEIATELKLK